MSIRFDAANDRITYTGTLPDPSSGFTITAWAYVSVNTSTYATMARLSLASGASTAITWSTDSNGLAGPAYFTTAGSVTNATGFTVGAWRQIAISCTGTTANSYVAIPGSATEADSGTVSDTAAPTALTLGGRAANDAAEWFNGRLAYVRLWSVQLTQAQIEAEWASTTPVVTSGLHADWPLLYAPDVTDHSGNGRNLVAGTTAATTEADPPITPVSTPTLLASYQVLSTGNNATALVSPSFTPSNGEVIVVKAGTWDTAIAMGTPSGGSQTWTPRVLGAPGGFRSWSGIFTTTVAGSPGAMTVTSTPTATCMHSMVIERWGSAQLAATPATQSANGATQPDTTLTTTAADSVVSWVSGDANGRDPTARIYRSSAMEDGIRDGHVGNNGVEYYAWQRAATAGSQTVGLSTPLAQAWNLAAIEIQTLSAAGPEPGRFFMA